MSDFHSSPPLRLGIFHLEDVCVRIQDGMGPYLKTAALQKTPAIEATFRWLRKRQIKIALLSDAGKKDTEMLLDRLRWRVGEEDMLQMVLTEQGASSNPLAEILELAEEEESMSTFSVSDTPRLLQAAASCGIRLNIGVTNGCYGYPELATEPNHALLEGPIQLPDFLLKNVPELVPENFPSSVPASRRSGSGISRQLPGIIW